MEFGLTCSNKIMETLLKANWTLIMVSSIDFQGRYHLRKHLNLNSNIEEQVRSFENRVSDANDWASSRIRLYCYPLNT